MKVILAVFLSCCFAMVKAQEKQDTAYLYFDTIDTAICQIDVAYIARHAEDGSKIKMYEKMMNDGDGVIFFYICGEMFNFNPSHNEKDTFNVSCLQQIDFVKLEDMIEVVNEETNKAFIPHLAYLYPDSYFKEIYIVEKINEKQVVRYNVYWQYYIE